MKKLLISAGLVIAILFSCNLCFANDDAGQMVKDAANGVRNVVGGAENTIENAAKDISNGSKNVTNGIENGAQNMTNKVESGTQSSMNDAYNATRTSVDTQAGTFMGMNSTAWTWLIMAIAAIAIVALVWYYGTQRQSSHYDDR